ncbi:MAG TPA: MFS transporter [Solirubrobacteraceae bacterium]|nr:MFS transporter [Solirubrobacteraceae bacterium]
MAYGRVLAAALLCYAALGAVLRALPGHLTELGAGPLAIGIAVGAPAVTGLVARPGGGRLADRVGPRAVLPAGAAIMAAGVVPALHDDVAAQVGSRLLVGVGEGLMMSAAVLWLLRLAGPERRGRALGHIGLANYGGLTAGPLLADALNGFESALLVAAILPLAAIAALPRAAPPGTRREPGTGLLRATLTPGIGLMLVNVGYAAVLAFGGAVAAFAITVIAARTLGAGIPDRFGPRATLAVAAPTAAAGLVIVATGSTIVGVVLLGAGQAIAVPSLGLLALTNVPPAQHGAAAGMFFAWFDAGVGLGGPAAGFLAHLGGPSGALLGAAAAVAASALVAGLSTIRPDAGPLVN